MDSTITSTTDVMPTLLAPVSADLCAACGSRLATDQRYCLECGERRGDPRLPVMNGRPPEPLPLQAPPARARGSRVSSGSTLIAGIGTLLLAVGVGVLIGRSNTSDQSAKAPPVQVVTLAGGGGAVAAGSPVASTSTPASSGATASSKAKKTTDSAAKAAGATTRAAAKTPPKVVQVGSSGTGKGYKNGKFTGDFFGP
ncbi:hypothetical protein FSW04_09770 [Baekduia soli]|uniref:Zinc ribbon domain-containing protein n=1 Tax=Baekduia soli TaxID=496014 RepID=A0A5B8U4P6_9ACTN|nr:hypothetical protein [Baekduia soli]QEC47828.1 hypothetical protein FSW04_09770 [Baekduia soli]